MFWIILFLILMLLAAAGTFYLAAGFHRFSFIKRLGEKHKVLAWVVSAAAVASLSVFALINWFTVVAVLLHLMIFWLAADLIGMIVRRAAKKPRVRNTEGLCAILFTAVYLSIGWYLANNVWETRYNAETDKNVGSGLRIAMIGDAHIGLTLDGEEFAEQMSRIQETQPDIVAVVGDFVDDETKRSDMVRACEALGELDTKYGVYFVYGNHDRGYYNSRDFTADVLHSELERCGVVILRDESVNVGDSFCIVGREDAYSEDRAAIGELMKSLDSSRYTIVLDHQPSDYDAEAQAGADLVLSGHTHGGPLFPAGQIGVLTGQNDRFIGTEQRGSTTFIVTSGISCWGIPFKTGTRSEYVIIDVKQR